MMTYPYCKETIHDNPELYMYAPFTGSKFLAAFVKQRRSIMADISGSKIEFEIIKRTFDDKLNFCHQIKDLIETEKLLEFCLALEFNPNTGSKPLKQGWINTFARKFEVIKKFWCSYDAQMRPINKTQVNIDTYIYFSFLLSHNLKEGNGIKRYNCLLKLNDYICVREHEWNNQPFLKTLMKKSIQEEIQYLLALIKEQNIFCEAPL